MKPTHLIQILRKNTNTIGNTLSFGGGLIYGGLPKQAFDTITKIWSFDYMGDSEFEWGGVPRALEKIANSCRKNDIAIGKIPLSKDVHYICPKAFNYAVEDIIRKLAIDEHKYIRLRKPCYLKEVLIGENFAQYIGGWLELDNGFMFFVDDIMYNRTLGLLQNF